ASWLDRVPDHIGVGPDLLLARASLLAGDRPYAETCSSLERAIGVFLRSGDEPRAALSLCRLISAAELAGGRWNRTVELAHRVLGTIPPETPLAPEARIRLAVLHVPQGDCPAAERELGEAERADAEVPSGLGVWAR